MARGSIFISYRRDDAAGYARAVADRLTARYSAERVFVDVEDIGAGQPFDLVIERAVNAAAVVLVLIGPRWRGERAGTSARLDAPDDVVRREVASALAGPARVIPVLLDRVAMPSAAQLPADLQALATRNAVELGNTRFDADMQGLLDAVDEALGTSGPAPARFGRRAAVLALAGAAGSALLAAGWWSRRPARLAITTSVPAPASAASLRAAVDGVWQAEVVYDWPNARYRERFEFKGDASVLHGSASFLGVPRGIEDGRVDAQTLGFVTRSAETAGDTRRDTLHRYRARVVGAELRFVMQTEGASTPHVAVEFVARRMP